MGKRVIEMDMARALATIAVVIIHISADPLIENVRAGGLNHFYLLLNVAARFAVPIFVLLSGLGLAMSSKQNEGYIKFVIHRLKKIVPAYAVWSIIYSLTYGETFGFRLVSLKEIALDFVTGKACYHLYFVPLIVILYLLYPLMQKWLKTGTGLLVSAAITITALCIGHYGSYPDRMEFLFDSRSPVLWIFYFALGIRMAHHNIYGWWKDKHPRLASMALLGCLALITAVVHKYGTISNSIDTGLDTLGPLIVLYTVLFTAWIWSRQWKNNPVVEPFRWISRHSYMIYLSHVFVLQIYIKQYPKWGIHGHGAVWGSVAFLCVAAVSLVTGLSSDALKTRLSLR